MQLCILDLNLGEISSRIAHHSLGFKMVVKCLNNFPAGLALAEACTF